MISIPPIRPLAQIDRADSAEQIFSDFLGQIPIPLVMMVCGAGFLLFLAFAWFAYFKPLRKARIAARQSANGGSTLNKGVDDLMPAPPNPIVEPTPVAASTASVADLPYEPSDDEPEIQSESLDSMDMDDADLPDLDMLVDKKSLRKELPDVDMAPLPPKPPRKEPSSAARRPASDGMMTIKLHTGALIRAEEVVSILRDPRDGRLVVFADGVGYRTLMDSPEAKQSFVKIMRELSEVVTKPDDNPPDVDAVPDEPAPPHRERSSMPPPPVTPDGRMPGDLPTYSLEDSVKPTRSGKYEAAPTPELNIAGAVEAYLQHKLRHTQEFSGRSIHVLPSPGGGVRIQVDNMYFEAVDEVDDAEVRDFLLETIQEWQSRQ